MGNVVDYLGWDTLLVMSWITPILVGAGVGAAALAVFKTMNSSKVDAKGLAVPEKAKPYLSIASKWASKRKIPLDVLLSWMSLESGFNKGSYNPEAGAMQKWACQIANDSKFASNPEYAKAKQVCQLLTSGVKTGATLASDDKSKAFESKLWTFGSVGLMQVSRIASANNGYAASRRNSGMFDPDTNIMVGTQVIASLRESIYGGKADLSWLEWSLVRAAYVMGAGGLKTRLSKGTQAALDPVHDKQRKFYAALSDIRGQAVPVNLVKPTVA